MLLKGDVVVVVVVVLVVVVWASFDMTFEYHNTTASFICTNSDEDDIAKPAPCRCQSLENQNLARNREKRHN